ncbi:MAG: signal peptidase II [Rhodothermales bacterium]
MLQSRWTRYLLIAVVLTTSVGCDQATKYMAREQLQHQPMVSLLGDTVRLFYTQNPGIAMSIGAEWSDTGRFLLTVVLAGILLLGVLVGVLIKTPASPVALLGYSIILGGGVSNLLDRLLREHGVVDFMMLKLGFFNTAVFNVADMLILGGVALLGWHHYRAGRPHAPLAAPEH